MQFFKKRVPIAYTLILAVICSALSFYVLKKYTTTTAVATEQPTGYSNSEKCSYTIERLKGYSYIKPLITEEPECESKELASLKQDIAALIDNEKQAGILNAASVYIKDFATDNWTSINPGERFLPGSLFKLPTLMTILKMSESDPSLLNRKIVYQPKEVVNIKQTYKTKSLQPGQSYTVKELLTYMIAYSDNSAVQLLNREMNPDVLIRLFSDLGLTPPKAADYMTYTITTRDYSIFMAALYNAAYLTIPNSEFATSLMAQCNFKDGLLKGLPADVKVAHKFGEAGANQVSELHETGIVYFNNSAYLITVMTNGPDLKKLAETISEISKITYARMKQNA